MLLESTKHQRAMRRIKLSFVLLLSAMVLIANLPAFANANANIPGKIYYVATTGSDENDGSQQSPWRTLQHAADAVKAGETVLVRGGTYKENVTFKNSGSATTGYITFQAYPGEIPVISGEESKSSTLVEFNNADYIIFDGFELTKLRTSDPNKYLAGIRVINSSSNIIIQNNHLYSIEHTGTKGNAHGIVIYGDKNTAIKNIKIYNNYLHDLILGSSEALMVDGNVDGFLIENNTIERVNNIGIDVAGFYGVCPSGCVDQARNGIVVGNKVSYVDTITNPAYRGSRAAAGIYVDGGTNTIIERNEVSYSNYGIEIASEIKGKAATNIVMRNNYIHHNQMSGLIMGGSSSSNGRAKDNLIINNTFYNNNQLRTGDGEITFQNSVQDNVFINNMFITSQVTPYFYDDKTSNTGNIIDYNLYFGLDAKISYWRLGNTRYTSFEQYQKATKQDQHSIVADPLFKEVSSTVLELSQNSPAIDAGTLSYKEYGMLDFLSYSRIVGHSIDIGAIEYGAGNVEPPETEPPVTRPPATELPATMPPTTEPSTTVPPVTKPPATEPPKTDDSPIVIDGIADEWDQYPSLATSSSNVKVLKSVINNDTLFVLVSGQLLKEKGQLYIQTQTSSQPFFQVPYWSNQKANYLIENGVLYQYSGDGKKWSWAKIKNYRNNEIIISNSIIEMAIPLKDLGIQNQNEIQIGYVWKDNVNNILPAGGAMSKVTADSEQPLPTTTPSPVETPESSIIIDGKSQDWSNDNILSETSDRSLVAFASNDSDYLYIAFETNKTFKKSQVYLNTDNDQTTGYQSYKWKGSGVDYLIEDNVLYRYGGDNKNWIFNKQVSLSKSFYASSPNFVEMKISLSLLGLTPRDTITIGVMLDDKTSLKLPHEGSFIQYELKQ